MSRNGALRGRSIWTQPEIISLVLEPRPEWMSQARCLNAPWSVFFPENGSRKVSTNPPVTVAGTRFRGLSNPERYAKAQYCLRCPVRPECLDQVLAEESDPLLPTQWGIQGGTTKNERERTKDLAPDRRRSVLQALTLAQELDGLVYDDIEEAG